MAGEIDEPIEVVAYDARWPEWYSDDLEELSRSLGSHLREAQHFGSTAVPGLTAKPIIDILVAPVQWPLADADRFALEGLGYEYLGEAGVAGREYFRRRAAHDTNLAVVAWGSPLWDDNLLLRDYLRAHPDHATAYGRAKQGTWDAGARTLLAYSNQKADVVAALLTSAKAWRQQSR